MTRQKDVRKHCSARLYAAFRMDPYRGLSPEDREASGPHKNHTGGRAHRTHCRTRRIARTPVILMGRPPPCMGRPAKIDAGRSISCTSGATANRDVYLKTARKDACAALRQPIITYCNGIAAVCQGGRNKKRERIWWKASNTGPKETGCGTDQAARKSPPTSSTDRRRKLSPIHSIIRCAGEGFRA